MVRTKKPVLPEFPTTRTPLRFLDRDTLVGWMRRNKQFQLTWQDLLPNMQRQTTRPIQKWVFATGFIAGVQFVRSELEAFPDMARDSLDAQLDGLVERIERKTKMGLVE